jgi:hypothetical protein
VGTKPPVVSAGYVVDHKQGDRPIDLDTPAWFTWLEAATTTSFSYPLFDPACGYIVGRITVRKERRRQGRSYWWIFRRSQGRVRKLYLGRSATVTALRLEAISRQVLQARSEQVGGGPRAQRQPPLTPENGNDAPAPGEAGA